MERQLFQRRLLRWFEQHGRKNLPWQENKTPYRVWISEIMLQQTQVAAVINYYQRFMQRFPNLASLAAASTEDVLHLWSGLGYYSRARNLHQAAQLIQQEYQGELPATKTELMTLPGIGESTAGAILAIAFGLQETILDGNVKRVLARLHGIAEPINTKIILERLWTLAKNYTPKDNVGDYTQAMMDLGATLCTRSKPRCTDCPLMEHCIAYRDHLTHTIPTKIKAKPLPVKQTTFYILQHERKILLCKRPDQGIWGGLWCFPEMLDKPAAIGTQRALPSFRHTFTHYHLEISPIIVQCKRKPSLECVASTKQIWYNPLQPERIGLPKPVSQLLEMML